MSNRQFRAQRNCVVGANAILGNKMIDRIDGGGLLFQESQVAF